MPDVNADVMRDLVRFNVDLLRVEAGVQSRVIKLIENMYVELLAKLGEKDVTEFTKARLNTMLRQAVDIIESYYGDAQDVVERSLAKTAELQAKHTAATLDRGYVVVDFSASLPTEAFLKRIVGNVMIMGAPSEEWWSRQARDTAFRFTNAVRQGIVAGDTSEQIVARVAGKKGYPGVMDVTRANARSLVHTSIQEVASEARRETIQKNSDLVKGIRQLSTLDSHTTTVCMVYDGAEWNLEYKPINGTRLPYNGGVPRHWGCRSVEVPITPTFKELGVNIAEPKTTRASSDGQVPGTYTFEDFLADHTKAEQDEMLGKGRADLWRAGKITFQDLLNQKGNPLTLKQLEAKYA